jgi:lipopolysaccharide export system protein LptA
VVALIVAVCGAMAEDVVVSDGTSTNLPVAVDEPATNRTVITSDRLTFDYRRSIAVFDGHVVVRDAQLNIDSDHMVVQFNKDNTVKSATAVGNVALCTGDKTGTCHKAIYFAKAGELLMMGKAVLVQERNRVSGDQITFYVNEDRVKVEPGSVLLVPQSEGPRSSNPFDRMMPGRRDSGSSGKAGGTAPGRDGDAGSRGARGGAPGS